MYPGSSNDGVVRRTTRKVKELLLDTKQDLFVIMGWSSRGKNFIIERVLGNYLSCSGIFL